jgi:hypothetical protein
MAYALVGTIGASIQGSMSSSVNPQWGSGESRTKGNLLICWAVAEGLALLPSQPSGWSTAVSRIGLSASAIIYYKIATGGDAAPTVPAVIGGVISAQVGEFSGNTSNSDPVGKTGTSATLVSPAVTTTSAVDDTVDHLFVAANATYYSFPKTNTSTDTLNNAVAVSTNNDSTSTYYHYDFCYGITTSNSSADSDSYSFSGTWMLGAAGVVASFSPSSVKVRSGSTWKRKRVKVWDGSNWVVRPVKVWDGSNWMLK